MAEKIMLRKGNWQIYRKTSKVPIWCKSRMSERLPLEEMGYKVTRLIHVREKDDVEYAKDEVKDE